MYTNFYNLKERPFNLTPDSHFLYLSPLHREAMGHLLYGIRERKGFILVSGEVGTGKTTLCRALIAEIEKEAEVGFIINSFLSAEELLKNINEDLSCHRGASTRKGLVDELNRYLLSQHEAGRSVVVLIDECQNLALPVLEQLRMLSNLETEKEKLLQIVLVGQPELRDMLAIPALRQLAQRIAVTCHLNPLTPAETARYIRYRLAVAAGDGPPAIRITDAAMRRFYRYSGGIPRRINVVCDRALLVGFVAGRRKITGRIARRAIEELRAHPGPRGAAARRRWMPALPAGAAAAAVAAALVYATRPAPPPLPGPPAGGAGDAKAPLAEAAAEAGGNGADAEGLLGTVLGPVAERLDEEAAPGAPPTPVVSPLEAPAPDDTAPLEEAQPQAASAPIAVPVNPEAEAAARLAALWGRGDTEPPEFGEKRDLHRLAGCFGMQAVACWGGGDFIRRMDLPCILFLRAPRGGRLAAVLSGVRGERAALRMQGGETRLLAEQELEEALCGRAVYFYPAGVTLPGLCAPGMRGPAVGELQRSLAAAGFPPDGEEGGYGAKTTAAVKRFQEDRGLPADGVAGAAEWMLLRSAEAGREVPRLFAGAAEGRGG